MRRVLALALALAAAAVAQSKKADEHAIDKRMDACTGRNPSTHGQLDCIGKAAKEWDAELNRAYRELTAQLNAAEKSALLAAQKAWLVYRDEEYKAIDRIYGKMEGTMYQPMRAWRAMAVVRARALELASYVSLLKGQ